VAASAASDSHSLIDPRRLPVAGLFEAGLRTQGSLDIQPGLAEASYKRSYPRGLNLLFSARLFHVSLSSSLTASGNSTVSVT